MSTTTTADDQSSPVVVESTATTTTTTSASAAAGTTKGVSASPVAAVIPSGLKSFLSGGVGGICVVLVGHPLDLIKVRMQTGSNNSGSSSVGRIFLQTFRQSGWSGLYRGVSAPLTAVTPIFALSFWGYDVGQRIVRYGRGSDSQESPLSLADKIIAGGLSGIPPTLLMAPSERIKVLMQTAQPGQYTGMMDCAKQVYQQGGLRSLFRGTVMTLARDVPGSMAWFGTYEAVKLGLADAYGLKSVSELGVGSVLLAGGCAGWANWIVSIPPDVIKSRVQSSATAGAWQVATTLYQQEGAGAFFKGIRPALIRAFPANAACFMGMETAQKGLQWADEQLYSRFY